MLNVLSNKEEALGDLESLDGIGSVMAGDIVLLSFRVLCRMGTCVVKRGHPYFRTAAR